MNVQEVYGKPAGVSDDQARRTIEFCCPVVVRDGVEWFDMEAVAKLNVEPITDALRWLIDRGDATEGFRAIREQHQPHRIRFEARP
jgi:hypothetical protein